MCTVTPLSELELSLEPQAAGRARAFLREVSCPAHQARVLDDAELLVSELVTNGIRYGAPPIVLRVECLAESGMAVAVTDHAPALPELRHTAPMDEGGRGLQLVDYISESWGVQVSDDEGKTTWFRLADPSRTPA